jgi:hypothetical protein
VAGEAAAGIVGEYGLETAGRGAGVLLSLSGALLGFCGIVDFGGVIQVSWRGVLGWVTAVEPKRLSGAAGFGWLIELEP